MKHPHADIAIEWFNDTSRAIQARQNKDYFWEDCGSIPYWHPDFEYRFKPEKEDDFTEEVAILYLDDEAVIDTHSFFSNVKLTFDGKTGKLKAAEIIE